MIREAIFHIPDVPFAYAEDENTLSIRLKAARNDIVKCTVYYKDRYDWNTPFFEKPMEVIASTSLFDYFGVKISLRFNRYRYFFRLEDNNGNVEYLYEKGLVKTQPKERGSFQYAYISKADVFKEVKWANGSIVYSIFPDRFCNGNAANDPDNVAPWGGKLTPKTICGGDLEGIIEKLPYIADLGVSLIYLTPIFKSKTNHKYNIDDYFCVDPAFGDVDLLKKLVVKCHELNIKVILDAVFNHCGPDFFAFRDVLEKGEKSRYKDWFFIDSFPVDTENVNYYAFGVQDPTMPKLNTANGEVAEYLLEFTRYWTVETGIDGWRLDVSDEVSHDFWKRFRKTVKSINPDALIIGENGSVGFLRGDEFDGTMNYTFRESCLDFFAERKISVTEFEDEIISNRMCHMDSINRNMFNLLDSHDSERFLTMCGGRKERLKCAVAFMFTYFGIPFIFYGDEIGLDGGYDPLCRKCMIWDKGKQDADLLNYYKKLCKIRNENSCLVYGDYLSFSNSEILAFKRISEDGCILVIINNNDVEKSISSDELIGSRINLLTDKEINLEHRLTLAPNEVMILK